MYDLQDFGLTDLIRLSAEIRSIDGSSLEDVAGRVLSHLRATLVDKDTGLPAVVLGRVYKTHRFGLLPADVRQRVAAASTDEVDEDTLCLTLLSTVGDEAAWNDRRTSANHQAIPLPSPEAVKASPMVHALVAQLGLQAADIVDPGAILVDRYRQDFNVFHVLEAEGSPFVPDQEFVRRYGVRSVIGFGGILPSREMWAVIVFSRCPVRREVAEFFRSVALSASVALLPASGRTFAGEPESPVTELELLRWRTDAMQKLLEVRESAVVWQTERLQNTLIELDVRARELDRSQSTLAASEARKSAVVDGALDAVISMDAEGRVAEFNPAAEAMFGYRRGEVMGEPMADFIIPERLRQAHWDGLAKYIATGHGPIINQRIEVTAVRANGEEFPIELTVTRVDVPGEAISFTAYMRDLTEIRRSQRELAELAETLQAALLPPTDVTIPGLDVALEYRTPVGVVGSVGGDFYDPFPVADKTWSVSIGDVCGKGAKAASLTGLVRDSIRSAEHHHIAPDETLREVNRLVMEDRRTGDDSGFCTAALVRLDLGGDRVSAMLALAGHPRPAIVRSSGVVELAGEPALPLGLFEDFESASCAVQLDPGDSIVLYTDGVTEARDAEGQLFGEDRLCQTLAASAGREARQQIDALTDAIVKHTPDPTDDIAIVVLRVPD